MAKKKPVKKATKKKATKKKILPSDFTAPRRPDADRRVRQAVRIARVMKVLELIQSRGRWTRKDIAAELEVSIRTVYRDLDVLRLLGVPYYDEGDKNFLRVRSDYRFPILPLNQEELLGLSLATVLTKSTGLNITAGAKPTIRKIAEYSNEETHELIDDAMRLMSVFNLKMADHSEHHEAIKNVQLALIQGKKIAGEYESPYEKSSRQLTIHPYRFCLIKRAWYVIGNIEGEQETKTFRVARFKTLRMLNQQATVPENFDIHDHFGNAWAVYRGEPSFEVELRFEPQAARVVTETIWHHTQKSKWHKDGSVTLTFQVDGLEEILHWILTWTGKVTIQKPEELRANFRKTLDAGIKMNSNS